MHETKREGYIRRIENALKSDTTKITNAIIFSEEATREILELLKEQPKRTEKRTETHACDCISREDVEQMVEDNILCYTHSDRPIDQDPDTECHMAIRIALGMLRKDLRKLPSVQPEIIRCKDCKWCEDADGSMCKNPASWVVATDRDFGCVLAERREYGSD